MKIALDPYMLRRRAADRPARPRRGPRLPVHRAVAAGGFHCRSSCTRGRTRRDRRGLRKALTAAGVRSASVLPLYRWSGPDEDERQAAVRYWKRAIQITVDLGVNGDELRVQRPARGGQSASEAQFWRSMEELLPVFEREGMRLVLEPHPDDFVEDGRAARRPGPRDRLATCVASCTARRTPSIRAATSTGDHEVRRAAADPRAHRRLLRPPRLVRPALHREPARLDRPRPPASRHRAGRGRLGRVLRARWPRWSSTASPPSCVFAWEERAARVVGLQPRHRSASTSRNTAGRLGDAPCPDRLLAWAGWAGSMPPTCPPWCVGRARLRVRT